VSAPYVIEDIHSIVCELRLPNHTTFSPHSSKLWCIRPLSLCLTSNPYNIAPAKADTRIIPSIPNPALLTPMGTTTPAAAPALPLAPGLLVPLLPPFVPLGVELAFPLGVDVAVAVLLLLQKMVPGAIPLSMKQVCRSETDCWTDRQ
jgi:hypothetical protein